LNLAFHIAASDYKGTPMYIDQENPKKKNTGKNMLKRRQTI
jgi:hypothetical protein